MTETSHSNLLVVILNSNKVLEYRRDILLSKSQKADLNTLDQKMNRGMPLDGDVIRNPNPQDKATFAANMLVSALIDDDEPKTAIACAYLATYYPGLKQIKANTKLNPLSIQLVFDEEYRESSPITFVAKDDLN